MITRMGVGNMLDFIKSLDTTSLITLITSFIVGLSVFIEIVPIKLNPWSWAFRKIGSAMFKDAEDRINAKLDQTNEKVKELSDELSVVTNTVEKVDTKVDVNEMDRIRCEIFSFARSCRNRVKHSKEEFDHIISQNKRYRKLLDDTGTENGVYEEEYEYILRLYRRRQIKNDFL